MIEEIEKEVRRRGISRICHFTPSRNLAHILAGKIGILATQHLEESEKCFLNPTDIDRWDGMTDHICTSIEIPNPYYFQIARNREKIFRDWSVLLIDPSYLWCKGTRFCPFNASTGHGNSIEEGIDVFKNLFSSQVRERGANHLTSCPTDLQAEVLIPDRILPNKLLGVVFADEAQAKREVLRWKIQELDFSFLSIYLCRALFDRDELRDLVWSGRRPIERRWDASTSD